MYPHVSYDQELYSLYEKAQERHLPAVPGRMSRKTTNTVHFVSAPISICLVVNQTRKVNS